MVRGEGRAFSAGLDLAAAGAADAGCPAAAASPRIAAAQTPTPSVIAGSRRPSPGCAGPTWSAIAAVQGHAIGAGFQLALACDLRVLAEDAQFTMAEVALGLVPDLGGTKRLVELVGYAAGLEICVTGRRVDAEEADRMGLATSWCPPRPGRGRRRPGRPVLAAPRDAVVEIKALLAGAAGRTFAEQEAAERAAQVRRIRDLAGLGE